MKTHQLIAPKQVFAPMEVRREIMQHFGVDNVAVTLAFRFQRNSNRSRAIRIMALELGGRIYDGSRDKKALKSMIVELETLKQNEAKESDEA